VAYPLVDFVRRNCRETIPSISQNLVQSLFRLLDCYFANYLDTEILIITA
jgi:dynein heavy chain